MAVAGVAASNPIKHRDHGELLTWQTAEAQHDGSLDSSDEVSPQARPWATVYKYLSYVRKTQGSTEGGDA